MSLNPNQYQNTSFLSVQRKREALWNVLQPGDPYDIRKSMIAKVPFDKKTFMGDHLELVCLFQAAQIERLSQFLDDFKIRYRQIERIKLDRHSYEIQIQQLTHKLAQQATQQTMFRQQNEKLKQFLKNQSLSKQGVEDSIKTKYEKLLVQAKGYEDQNVTLRQQNQQLSTQMSSFDAKYEALKKSIHTEYDEKMRQSQTSMSSQLEINSLRSQYESEVQRLDLQNKRIKQFNEEKTREIQSWQSKYKILEQQLLRSSPKSEKKIAEYQNRFVIFGQQIDRLNLVIKEISNKYEISEQRNHEYEVKYDALSKEMMMLQSGAYQGQDQSAQLIKRIAELEAENKRLQESGRFAKEYEAKLRQANEQILRLGGQLRVELENANILREQVQRYQYEESRIKVLQKELFEYKEYVQNHNLKVKIAQDENQVAILKQEIERLREELSKRNGLEGNQRTLSIEVQTLQSKLADWQRKYQMTVQQYEMRINQKVSEYESRIQNINRTKGYEYENKAAMLQSEMQRATDMLKRKQEEVQHYQKQIRQLEYSITNKYELDTSRKVQNYETVIQGLKRDNQQLVRRIRELQPLQRKVNQYENKSTITSQQIQRLTQQIRSRQNDMENMRRQIREQQIAIVQKFEMDTSRKLGNYENILNDANRENQQLKRKYTEIQNKAALLSQQIQRLTNNLREFQLRNTQYEQEIQRLQRYTKQTEINITKKYEMQVNQKVTNYETVIRNNQREIEELRRRVVDLENSNRKLVEYESQLKMASQQIQRLNGGLRQKQQQILHLETNQRNLIRQFEELGRKYNELQLTVRNKFQVEATRTITTLEQNLSNFKRQNDELKRIIQEYESRVKKQVSDFQGLTLNLRNLAQQNEGLKRQIIEVQNSYRNKFEVEVTGKYRSYESNLTEIKRQLENVVRENNQLKRVLQNAEQTNIRLNQQNQELRKRFQQDFGEASKRISEYESRINQLQNQNQGFRRKVIELETIIRQKYEIQASRRISNLDQTLANAARQNQELRRRLQQATRELQELRKVAQRMERDNEELARKLRQFGDINKKVIEYENKISLLTQQIKVRSDDLTKADVFIKELTQKLQNAQRNMSQSQSSIQQFQVQVKNRITQYEQNIQLMTQQNNELKRRLAILDDMNRKIVEYENKIMILNQQLERININLKNQVQKSNQLENALRNSGTQNENLRRNLIEIQNTVTQKYQVEANRAISTLEQNFNSVQKQNAQLKKVLQEYQQTLNAQNSDLQKFNINLKNLSEENNMLQNQLRQTELSIVRKYETEVNSRQSAYEKDITNMRRQNQQLTRKLRELVQRVIPEYENQIAILKQQIERLSHYSKQQSGQLVSNLKTLGQQNQNLKRQILELQQTFTHKIEGQVNVKYASYEQNIGRLQKENDQLKKYIQQLGSNFEGQMKGFSQKFTLLQRQNEDLKRNIQELSFRYESENKKAGNIEQNLTGLARQNEDLKRRLTQFQQEMEKLVRKINELQQQNQSIRRQAKQGEIQVVQKFQVQTTQQINVYKQQIAQFENQLRAVQRQNEELQRRLNDFGGQANRKIVQYEEQLKRAVAQIERTNLKIRQYETKLRELVTENDGLKRQLKQTQIGITQRWQSQLRAKVTNYEQVITNLKRQNQQLDIAIKNMSRSFQDKQMNISSQASKRIAELQSKVSLLSQQLEHLTQSLRLKVQQNERMLQQIQRLNNTLRLKVQESKQYETEITKFRSSTQSEFSQLQSNYTLITRQNENYKKHLFEYENSIKKLYGEFERLQNIINDLKRERQSLFEKNYALSTQIDRLLNQNKDLEVQVEDVRLRLTDESALSRRVNEHMGLMVVLFAEIQSLRKRVKDKERQVEDVRRSSLAPFKLDKSRPKMESI